MSEDPKLKQTMMCTLHIRLSLVGKMFDFILVSKILSSLFNNLNINLLLNRKIQQNTRVGHGYLFNLFI
jgi:hypothetical protein